MEYESLKLASRSELLNDSGVYCEEFELTFFLECVLGGDEVSLGWCDISESNFLE